MNKKKKLYIAIGTYKTGTTAIQDFLRINKKTLAKDGLDTYIVVRDCEFWGEIQKQLRVKYHFPEERKLYHYIDSGEFQWKKELDENSGLLVQDIQKYIKTRKSDVFLAFQGLYDFHPERLGYKLKMLEKIIEPILDEYEIYLIIYFRHQDSFIEGVYNTWNQPYFEAGFDDFLKMFEPYAGERKEKAEIDWLKITEGLKEQFPHADIIVNSYELASKEGLFSNLCKNINLNISNYRLPKKDANPGLNEAGIHLMRSAGFLSREERARFHSMIIKNESIRKKPGEKYSFVSKDDRKALFDYYYRSNKELFALSDSDMTANFGNYNDYPDPDRSCSGVSVPEKVLIQSLLECHRKCISYKIEQIWLKVKYSDTAYKIYFLIRRYTR